MIIPRVYDDFFDKKWLDELTHRLIDAPWYANNVANSESWPYKVTGTHRILGDCFFNRISDNHIEYNKDLQLSNILINSFDHIQVRVGRQLRLMEIFSNLQFAGMNSTIHKDGTDNQTAFILMLCNEEVHDMEGGFYHEPTNSTIDYKYGRVIEFKASDPHQGLTFTKPGVARMTIKYLGTNVS